MYQILYQLVSCSQEGETVVRCFVCVVTTALFNLIPVAYISEVCVSVCCLLNKGLLFTAN